MIVRIVKMSFRPEEVKSFLSLFDERKERIRNFEGCNHLTLLQGVEAENMFFTYSFWNSELDLENYRNSDLFKETWSLTKVLFDSKPQAWSTEQRHVLT